MTSSDRKQGHARAPLVPLRSFPSTTSPTEYCLSLNLILELFTTKTLQQDLLYITVNGVDCTCLELLRLLNKLAATAAPFLFKVILVCTAVRKFERLTAISEIPLLSQCPKEKSSPLQGNHRL